MWSWLHVLSQWTLIDFPHSRNANFICSLIHLGNIPLIFLQTSLIFLSCVAVKFWQHQHSGHQKVVCLHNNKRDTHDMFCVFPQQIHFSRRCSIFFYQTLTHKTFISIMLLSERFPAYLIKTGGQTYRFISINTEEPQP
jgi:hypothetical protein